MFVRIICRSELQDGNVPLPGADRIGPSARETASNLPSAPFMSITRRLRDIVKPGCRKGLPPERRAGARQFKFRDSKRLNQAMDSRFRGNPFRSANPET